MVQLNHSGGSRGGGGGRITPGRYPVLIVDAQPDTSRSGNDMLVIKLRCPGGFELQYRLPLHLAWRVDNMLEALGQDSLDSEQLPGHFVEATFVQDGRYLSVDRVDWLEEVPAEDDPRFAPKEKRGESGGGYGKRYDDNGGGRREQTPRQRGGRPLRQLGGSRYGGGGNARQGGSYRRPERSRQNGGGYNPDDDDVPF